MIDASRFLICFELMIEKILAQNALVKPKIIPRVNLLSNSKIKYMPLIIANPVKISSLDIFCLFKRGSKMAVNKVKEERQTRVTDTVEDLIECKKSIQ